MTVYDRGCISYTVMHMYEDEGFRGHLPQSIVIQGAASNMFMPLLLCKEPNDNSGKFQGLS